MNRKAMKTLAKKQVQSAGKAAKLVTLIFLLLIVGFTLISYLPNLLDYLPRSSSGYLSSRMSITGFLNTFSYVFTLLMSALLLLLQAGYTSSAVKLLNDGSTSAHDLLDGLQCPLRVIIMNLLKSFYLIVWCYAGALIPTTILVTLLYGNDPDRLLDLAENMDAASNTGLMVGILAIVSVLYLIVQYRYRMSTILLMENPKLTAFQAVRNSVLITKGHRFQLFLLDLSFLPWYLLSLLTCGILFIWKLPYIRATEAAACHILIADYEQRRQAAASGRAAAKYPPLTLPGQAPDDSGPSE